MTGLRGGPCRSRAARTGGGPGRAPAPDGDQAGDERTAETALRAATRTGSQTGENGGA